MRRVLAAFATTGVALLLGGTWLTSCDDGCPDGTIRVCEFTSGDCACGAPCDAEGRCPSGTQCLAIGDTEDQVCVPPNLYSVDCKETDGGKHTCFQSFCSIDDACNPFCDHNAECSTGCCYELSGGIPGRALVVRVCRPPDSGGPCIP